MHYYSRETYTSRTMLFSLLDIRHSQRVHLLDNNIILCPAYKCFSTMKSSLPVQEYQSNGEKRGSGRPPNVPVIDYNIIILFILLFSDIFLFF